MLVLCTSQRLAKFEWKSVDCLLLFLIMSVSTPKIPIKQIISFISIIIGLNAACWIKKYLKITILTKKLPVKHWSNWVKGVSDIFCLYQPASYALLPHCCIIIVTCLAKMITLNNQDASISMLCILPADYLSRNRIQLLKTGTLRWLQVMNDILVYSCF